MPATCEGKPGERAIELSRISPVLVRLLRARWYPTAIQALGLLAIAGLLWNAFRPPAAAERSLTTEALWGLWWPLLALSVLVAGRAWCGVCPYALVIRIAERWGLGRRVPPRLARTLGWFPPVGVVAFGVVFLAYGLDTNAAATGALLIGFGLAAALLGLLVKGRTFCRYICPVGAMLGAYAPASVTGIQMGPGASNQDRQVAARICPVGTAPFARDRDRACHLCGDCLKALPPGRVGFVLRAPGVGLRALRRAPAAVALIPLTLLAILLVDTVRMTPWFPRYIQTVAPAIGGYKPAVVLLTGLGLAVVLVGTAALVRLTGQRLAEISTRLAAVGFALYLAMSVHHLYAGGLRSVQNVALELGIGAAGHIPPPTVFTVDLTLKAVEIAILAAGLAIALGTRVGRPRLSLGWIGRGAPATAASIFGVILYLQPMSSGC